MGRRTKGKKRNIAFLRNDAGVPVTSAKSKHYEQLGRVSVDSDFDFKWKKIVERKVSMCSSLSGVCGDETLDRGIEIVKCIRRLRNIKTGSSDGLVGEWLKYGGSGMVYLLEHFYI